MLIVGGLATVRRRRLQSGLVRLRSLSRRSRSHPLRSRSLSGDRDLSFRDDDLFPGDRDLFPRDHDLFRGDGDLLPGDDDLFFEITISFPEIAISPAAGDRSIPATLRSGRVSHVKITIESSGDGNRSPVSHDQSKVCGQEKNEGLALRFEVACAYLEEVGINRLIERPAECIFGHRYLIQFGGSTIEVDVPPHRLKEARCLPVPAGHCRE